MDAHRNGEGQFVGKKTRTVVDLQGRSWWVELTKKDKLDCDHWTVACSSKNMIFT